MSFFAELRRRNVVRVGIAYVVGAWLLIQVGDVMFEAFAAPEWAMRGLVIALAIGMPLFLIAAWALELTPEGIKWDSEVDHSQPGSGQSGKKLNNVILALSLSAVAYLLFDKIYLSKVMTEPAPGSVALADISRQSIAVLPFTNRSLQTEDEFFVEGVHDDLLTNLSRISDLKVISRNSVLRYRDTEMPSPDIANELGVATIMQGAVQRSGNTVRINVQLIDAATDDHIWAEIYDRELTAENLFAIQSEISEAIALALESTLSPEEQQRIYAVPTENLAASDAYMKGRQLMATRSTAQLEAAIGQFRTAVDLDPKFALAWVGLADSTSLYAAYGPMSQREANAVIKEALDRALAIDPDLGEAYASLGIYYHGMRMPDEASAAFEKAILLSPGYATAYHWYAWSLPGLSNSRKKLDLAKKARDLDPNATIIRTFVGRAYSQIGWFELGEQQTRQALALNPDSAISADSLAIELADFQGRYAEAVVYSQQANDLDPQSTDFLWDMAWSYLELRDFEGYETVQSRMEAIEPQSWEIGLLDALQNLMSGNLEAARETTRWMVSGSNPEQPALYWAALTAAMAGDTRLAFDLTTRADPGWLDPENWAAQIDDSLINACTVAWLFAENGQPEKGSQLLNAAIRYMEDDLPGYVERPEYWSFEGCYLLAGEPEKALDLLERKVNNQAAQFLNIYMLFPWYEQIRHEPRYQAIMAHYHQRMDEQLADVERMRAEGQL